MPRLLVHVEGETEEAFVNEILRPHLYGVGYTSVGARIVGNARLRSRRGGIRPWPSVRDDIVRHLRSDVGSFSTTMVDYYALPCSTGNGWPGRAGANSLPFDQKADCIENSLYEDVLSTLPAASDRFVPYVMMHEFEGLLFSDCVQFAKGIAMPELADSFQAVRDQFGTPEEINDSPETAPSKRVVGIVEEYNKPLHGNIAILEIGLGAIRRECPYFDRWISRLELLAS